MVTRARQVESNNDHSFRDLATLLALFVLAGLLVVGIGLAIALPILTGTSLASLASTLLAITNKTPWHLSRSAGTVAYLLLTGSTIWGLLQSSKIAREAIPAGLAFAMHNILSWLALGFTGFHALVLLLDNYYSYTLPALTIPFIGPYRPGWVGLGIMAFYLMLIVTISFQFRKQIGQSRWRALHYLSFGIFVLATIHGVAAGTDSSKPAMQLMYLGCGLVVFFLSNYRLLTGRAQPSTSTRITNRR
jgi:predicted ferric reductase